MTHLRRELVRGANNMWRRRQNIIRYRADRPRRGWEIGVYPTIPYTGTWGVVIGKATGAGAWQG